MTKSTKGSGLNRRRFLRTGMLSGAAAAAAPLAAQAQAAGVARFIPPFDLDEISIAALQEGMKSGKFTARSIAEKYLARIDAIDKHGPALNSVIELNPDALDMADALDRERQAQGPRGPLHGIPVLIKDNIATRDRMQTTAGSLALVGSVPPKDAFVAKKLRDGGRGDSGQDQLERVGQYPLVALHQRLERARRADAQSLRA